MDYILDRRSVRNFDLDKKIDKDTLELLCKYGEAAPSARKQKSREYIIIDDKSIINELENIYVRSTMRPKNCNYMIAVIGVNPDSISNPEFQPTDLALATENIMLKARELGIGSVMLGTYPNEERLLKANKLLNLDDNRFVFTFICLGYPKDKDAFYVSDKINDIKIGYNK